MGSPSNASADKNAYPVFPNKDAGADPSVPAEQGGRGFTGEGWETNTDYDLIGDPQAVKGGTFTQSDLTDFPSTLRLYGPNASAWDQMVHGLGLTVSVEKLKFHPEKGAYAHPHHHAEGHAHPHGHAHDEAQHS